MAEPSKRSVPKVPRSWKRDRIEATHFIYNGWVQTGGGKAAADINAFDCGWRTVRLNKVEGKYASVQDCGTGVRARIELKEWQRIARHGRELPAKKKEAAA